VLFDFDLRALVAQHRRTRAAATLALIANPDPRRYSRVVMRAAGRIAARAGLPRPARGRPWLFTGLQMLDPALLERLPPRPSDTARPLFAPPRDEGVGAV